MHDVPVTQLCATLKDMLEEKNVFEIFFMRFYLGKSVPVSMKVINIRNLYNLFLENKPL